MTLKSNPAMPDDTYQPVVRDRTRERARCEAKLPGYTEARATPDEDLYRYYKKLREQQ